MRNLMKYFAVAAMLVMVAGVAVAGAQLNSIGKVVPQKDAYTGPMDRGMLDCSGAVEVDLNVGTYYGDNTGAPTTSPPTPAAAGTSPAARSSTTWSCPTA